MKKIFNVIILLLTCIPGFIFSQTVIAPDKVEGYTEIPKEKVFVHYNSSLLFAGEYIYYKLYVLDATSGKPGALSQIAYLELVGEDGSKIFRHKVKLENGTGGGDFFIPTAVPSGNYKLLGYTQWMLNDGMENIFQSDVAILNPYRGDQREFTPGGDADADVPDVLFAEEVPQSLKMKDPLLKLTVSGQNFSPRQRVELKLTGNPGPLEGNFSVSVRKVENFIHPAMPASENYWNSYPDNDPEIKSAVHLPELRGDLLWGRIESAGNTGAFSVENRKILLSIPGKDYVVKVAGTNRRGEFFFNIDEEYSGSTAFLEVFGDEKEQYQILLSQKAEPDYKALDFNKFYISPAMEEMIVKRSVYNQVENAYYGVKPDTLLAAEGGKPFYEMQPILYDLDEYTRFPTIRETFVEIVKEAYVRNVDGEPVIRVRPLENATSPGIPPLLLVDGVIVQDHTAFLDVPAKEIQRIGVIRNNYYLGPQLFQGVLDVKTIPGNFHERYTPGTLTSIELEKPQGAKSYFKQRYDRGLNENIPDFRYQLLWQPSVPFTGNEVKLDFYTSDVKGDFEIHVEGFTKDGIPVSLKETIKVM